MKVGLITDGQTDVDLAHSLPNVALESVGGLAASQAFKGNITITSVDGTHEKIWRANGSDLGSFIDEGFQKGQRINLSGTPSSNGDYIITDLAIGYLTITPAPALPGHPAGTLGGCAARPRCPAAAA